MYASQLIVDPLLMMTTSRSSSESRKIVAMFSLVEDTAFEFLLPQRIHMMPFH
jgi:hypothetical protein